MHFFVRKRIRERSIVMFELMEKCDKMVKGGMLVTTAESVCGAFEGTLEDNKNASEITSAYNRITHSRAHPDRTLRKG